MLLKSHNVFSQFYEYTINEMLDTSYNTAMKLGTIKYYI